MRQLRVRPWQRELLTRGLALAALVVMVVSAVRWRVHVLPELDPLLGSRGDRSAAQLGDLLRIRSEALRYAAAGGLLMLAAVLVSSRMPTSSVHAPGVFRARRGHWLLLAAGVVALLALARINSEPIREPHASSHIQHALLWLGAVLVGWGLSGQGIPWTRWRARGRAAATSQEDAGEHRSSATGNWRVRSLLGKGAVRQALLVGAITALALGLRVWGLNDTLRTFVDEVNFSDSVRLFWHRGDVQLLTPISGTVAFPRLYTYWQNEMVAVAGRSLAALRLPSAILGTLTIPAMYLLARAFFDRSTALIAALLLATFPPHVHFSRLGLNNIADPLFGTLAFACLGWGLRTGRQRDFALAGVALGLTQYFYEGGRMLFPGLMLGWLALNAAIWWRRRVPLRGLLVMACVAALVAMPVYLALLAQDLPLFARVGREGAISGLWHDLLGQTPSTDADSATLAQVRQRLVEQFLFYVQMPEAGAFYRGDTPLVLVLLVPFLLLGVVAGVAWSGPGGLLVVLWIVGVAAGNSLLKGRVASPRHVVVLPALMLLSAVGLRAMALLVLEGLALPRLRLSIGARLGQGVARLRLIADRQRLLVGLSAARNGRRVRLQRAVPVPGGQWLMVPLVIALAALQIAYYFGPHLDTLNIQIRALRPYPDGDDAMLRAAELPAGTSVYLISDPLYPERYAQLMVDYLADGLTIQALTPAEVSPDWLGSLSADTAPAFFVGTQHKDLLDDLAVHFPCARVESSPHEIPIEKQYVLYSPMPCGREAIEGLDLWGRR